jgi:hypothetical protein
VVYNVGVGAAVCGMVVACVGALWVLGSPVLRWVSRESVSGSANLGHQLARRDVEIDGMGLEGADKSRTGSFGLTMIVRSFICLFRMAEA